MHTSNQPATLFKNTNMHSQKAKSYLIFHSPSVVIHMHKVNSPEHKKPTDLESETLT